MKRLLITDCSDPQMWYANLIGEYVDFLREDAEGYWSREPAGHTNIVRREDAQVVSE